MGLRPGKVVTIRVNPHDCMSVLDVLEKANIPVNGMSFAAIVSTALSSAMQTFRDQQVIPERDGFEYSEMMAPYTGVGSNRRKLEITDALQKAGNELRIKGISKPRVENPLAVSAEPTAEPRPVTAEVREASRRLTELLQKKDLAETPASGVLWSDEDQAEYTRCYHLVYPEG